MKHDEHMVTDFGFYVLVAGICIVICIVLYATYRVLS